VKDFGDARVLHGLDLEIGAGEFVSLLGPSGCGKTTVLRLIAGLEQLTDGVIRMGGQDVSTVPVNRRDIGMVFQAYSLFPHLTVLENTCYGLKVRKAPKDQARVEALRALRLVGLEGFAGRYPHELSGGQQQRVALARALAPSPRVLLMDEPLSALDAKVRVQLREEIRRIQLELGITTVFVTHDQEEALAISDRVAVMAEGRIGQIGTPDELYRRPANPMVAAFIGLSNVLAVRAGSGRVLVLGREVPVLPGPSSGEALDATQRTDAGTGSDAGIGSDVEPWPDAAPGRDGGVAVEVFVRPEHVRLAGDAEPGAPATARHSVFLGGFCRTDFTLADGQELVMQHPASTRFHPGQAVRLTVESEPVFARPVVSG
jgi:putative spermidine/putrescine transport system ATP-binding protein